MSFGVGSKAARQSVYQETPFDASQRPSTDCLASGSQEIGTGTGEMPVAEEGWFMSSAFCIYEGDYCFSLPPGFATQSQVHQEKKMKTRSESVSKAKGNGSARQAQVSLQPDSSSANDDCPREQMIAEAAYFHAERRGFTPGNEMSDWLQAEADVEGLPGSSQ